MSHFDFRSLISPVPPLNRSAYMRYIAKFLFPLVILLLASCSAGGPNSPRIQHAVSYSGFEHPSSHFKSMVEGSRSVYGRIRSKSSDEHTFLITLNSNQEIDAKRGSWNREKHIIDPSQIYHIELLNSVYTDLYGITGQSMVRYKIFRISKDDNVLVDTSICHVHGLRMERQLEDGKSAEGYPESFFPLQLKKFPNDGNTYLGCGNGVMEPKWKCSECNRAYHNWTKKHGINENY